MENERKRSDYYCLSGRNDCEREQRRLESLQASEERYQNLFEAVRDGLLCCDLQARLVQINQLASELLGLPGQQLLGRRLSELFGDSPQLEAIFSQVRHGEAGLIELPYRSPGGRQLILELRLSPIRDYRQTTGVLLLARDLTAEKHRTLELRRLYEELQLSHQELEQKALALEASQGQLRQAVAEQERVNAELRELGRLKSDFIGIASHELRTPLTFLLGSLEYLTENVPARLNGDERGLLDYAMQGAQRLAGIVENMLDIVRLEAEGFRPQKQQVSIYPLLEQVAGGLQSLLRQWDLTLQWASREFWPELLVDPAIVRRALEDVIENAIKYTEPGGQIEIKCQLRSREDLLEMTEEIRPFWPEFPTSLGWEGSFFEIIIQDNGIGIPRQELSHIFESFFTAGRLEEHSSGMKFRGEGAGLGLALVKRIVRGHGGLVWAHSPGSKEETGLEKPGSRFHLLFPLEQLPASKQAVPVGRKRILLIDHEPSVQHYVKGLLRSEYELDVASGGAEGLEKAQRTAPDLILLDLHLPGMDGFEVCRQLQADPETKQVPVAIVSAADHRHERGMSLQLGAIDYITKPFFPRELQQRIKQLLNLSPPRRGTGIF